MISLLVGKCFNISIFKVENALATYMPDAMVIVYSVVDVMSLKIAEDILQYLWKTGSATDKATILVGNKSDLVRTRIVPIVGNYLLPKHF